VRIADGQHVLACHPRCWGKGEQIETPEHVKALTEEKRAAHRERATDRLTRAVPAAPALLKAAAEHGYPLARITADLTSLLDQYGAAELQVAVTEALERESPPE
jgi:phosphoglycolate phosphatase-like HAD superfamily hydrolase